MRFWVSDFLSLKTNCLTWLAITNILLIGLAISVALPAFGDGGGSRQFRFG